MLNFRTLFLAAGLCTASSAVAARPAAAQSTITCESSNNQFRDCRVATGGKVRLQQNISQTRCDYGRTWGFDWNSIWVDRGCRGRFLVNGSGSGWESGNYGQRVTCESSGGSFKICNVATYGYVRLVRQISQSACVAGRTWGYQSNQIWVGNGCRAEFEVGSGDSNWDGDARVVTCSSSDGRYSRCFARTEGKVSLQKQLSSQACVLQRTWGYDQNGIWVDNGCRGQFVVGRGGPGSGWGEYPGTWPGAGGGNGGNMAERAKQTCTNEAQSRGYQSINVVNATPSGSMVNVVLRGTRSNRQYQVNCQYATMNSRAQIVSESPVPGGGGGGGGNGLVQRGSDACRNKAGSMGYQSINVTNARQNGSDVTVNMNARNSNRSWNLTCIYRQSNNTATMTQQSEVGSGGGSGGGNSNLYGDAKNSCENTAKSQGYQVIGSGPAQIQSWGVKHELDLRKGGLQYSNAYCNYMQISKTATVTVGTPDKQPR